MSAIIKNSDFEKVRCLLTELGIGYVIEKSEIIGAATCIRCGRMCGDKNFDQHAKVGGYTDFYTSFEFTDDGQFIEIGAWE
jgi:hypothetical protein